MTIVVPQSLLDAAAAFGGATPEGLGFEAKCNTIPASLKTKSKTIVYAYDDLQGISPEPPPPQIFIEKDLSSFNVNTTIILPEMGIKLQEPLYNLEDCKNEKEVQFYLANAIKSQVEKFAGVFAQEVIVKALKNFHM